MISKYPYLHSNCQKLHWIQKQLFLCRRRPQRQTDHTSKRQFFFSTAKEEQKGSTGAVPSGDQRDDFKLTLRQKKAIQLLSYQNPAENPLEGNAHDLDLDDEGRINELTDISQTLAEFKEQTRIQDLEHYEDRPIPWYNLLTFPSRALWRSSPKPPPTYLTDAQFDIIQRSEKTPKQLRRTMEKIVINHTSLSEKRERERRFMVNKKKIAPTSLLAKKIRAQDSKVKPVYYKPEHSLSSLKFRLVPNYNITKRVLRETQSLIGKETFQPKKVLDVGIGVGSSSAAILDLAFERCNLNGDKYGYRGVEWVHGIDPSRSMRDGAKRLLSSVLEGHQSDDLLSDGTAPRRAPNNTRITFGENLTGTVNRDILQSKGTFDLALCTYTLCEIPNLPSSLALAAIIWEKLSPNGVAVFIEPGTPDGFNSLRSVRSMLLDCCPPRSRDEKDFDDDVIGDEECHVVAPCTHNGECPMVRHKKNFLKRNDDEESNTVENRSKSISDYWSVGEGEEGFDEEFDFDSDSDDEELGEDFTEDDAGWEDDDEDDDKMFFNNDMSSGEISQGTAKSKSSLLETDVFNSSFCSFIHGMPGGEGGKRGEKFSYLVVQKRITGESIDKLEAPAVQPNDPFRDVDVVDLLLQSMESRKTKAQAKESQKGKELLKEAIRLEDNFVQSDEDKLGLELVKGRTHSWGRIVRAPIKKKGHVIVDYCTSSRVEGEELHDIKEEGKIIRQKISRKPTDRAAPGTFTAARKSRWGGLWPDISQDK